MDRENLLKIALEARKFAYAPYSHFTVGAALLAKNGTVYSGCNIENAAYGPSNCAERTAFFKAISEGNKDFCAIAVVGGLEGKEAMQYCPPCGVCRQVMAEFCSPEDFLIILGAKNQVIKEYKLKELLPVSFSLNEN
ncbi:Cytidine deaminase [Clostridiales bacterium CHKCI001]|nr:Cytidine deaminase [Clostridiales bacterium CHKCI001]